MGALAQRDQATSREFAETNPRQRPQCRPSPRGRQHQASWNVLAEELVPFPPTVARAHELERAYRRAGHKRGAMIGTGQSAARSLSDPAPSRFVEVVPSFRSAYPMSSIDPVVVRAPQARSRRACSRPQARGWQRLLPGAATLVVLASLLFGAGALSDLHHSAMSVPASAVKVKGGYLYIARPGDTLWSIASDLQPGGDPRPLVAQLEQQLHGAELVAGDELKLP